MLFANHRGKLLIHSVTLFNNMLVTTPSWRYFSSPKAAKSHTTSWRKIICNVPAIFTFSYSKRSSNPLYEGQGVETYMEKMQLKLCRPAFPNCNPVHAGWEFFNALVRKSILQQNKSIQQATISSLYRFLLKLTFIKYIIKKKIKINMTLFFRKMIADSS